MRWTDRELARLHLHYETEVSWTRLKNQFPGRSKNSIKKKAKDEGLNRDKFDTRRGFYFSFAKCPICKRIPKNSIKWRGKHLNVPYCSKCSSRVKILPKSSKLRRKYRDAE